MSRTATSRVRAALDGKAAPKQAAKKTCRAERPEDYLARRGADAVSSVRAIGDGGMDQRYEMLTNGELARFDHAPEVLAELKRTPWSRIHRAGLVVNALSDVDAFFASFDLRGEELTRYESAWNEGRFAGVKPSVAKAANTDVTRLFNAYNAARVRAEQPDTAPCMCGCKRPSDPSSAEELNAECAARLASLNAREYPDLSREDARWMDRTEKKMTDREARDPEYRQRLRDEAAYRRALAERSRMESEAERAQRWADGMRENDRHFGEFNVIVEREPR